MLMSKPVVAYAHGALPEIVVSGETGWLIPPGDESALSDAVLALLNDPARRRKMGLAGKKRVGTYFTVQRMINNIDKLLAGLVQ
jgi:glycosyltransferase involved in cell wall biosynthesis